MIRYAFDLYPRDDPISGTRLVRFSDLQEAQYRGEANGSGSGSIELRATSSDAAFIDPEGLQYIRVVRINTAVVDGGTLSGFSEKVVGGFFLENGDYAALTKTSSKLLKFTGAGTIAYLDRAAMANESHIAGFITQDPFDDLWRMYNSGFGNALGEIFWRIIAELQDVGRVRDPIPGVTITFDVTQDSDGNPWVASSGDFTAQVGESVLRVTKRLTELGLYVEMDPDTFELSAWEPGEHGRDRSGGAWGASVIRFQAPTGGVGSTSNILSDAKRGLGALVTRSHLLVGANDVYEWVDAPGSPDFIWEGAYRIEDETGDSFANAGAQQLRARSDAGDTVRLRTRLGTVPANGYYLPFESAGILLDDTATLHTGAGQWDWNESDEKVAALTLILREAGDWDLLVDLGSNYSSLESRQFSNPVGAHNHPLRLCGGLDTDWLLHIPRARLKSSGEWVAGPAPRELANDGDDDTTWGEGTSDDPLGVAEAYWAADIGSSRTGNEFRILQMGGGNPTIQNVATEVRIYGSNDPDAWTWLPSGKITADPAANDWTLAATYTRPLTLGDSGRVAFTPGIFRYWLFRAVTGGTADWDVETFEIWESHAQSGGSNSAARCDHSHIHNDLTGRDAADSHPATASAFTPAGTIAATNVQAAIEEASGDTTAHLADADAHNASSVSIADAGGFFVATEVEAALQELGAGGAGGTIISYLRKTADQVSTSTAFADVTGLIFAVQANTNYRFRFVVFFVTSAAAEGMQLSVNGPAGTYKIGGIVPSAAPAGGGNAALHASGGAADTIGLAATSGPGASGVMAIIEAVVLVGGAGGNVALRMRAENGGAASVTVQANSYGEASVLP